LEATKGTKNKRVLVKKYNNLDKEKRDKLVADYLPAVKKMAYKLKERLPDSIEYEELFSIGVEEMVKKAKSYDSAQNDNFWGFCKKRVNGAMLDYLRGLDIISRANRKIIKSIAEEVHKYYNIHQEEPNDEYLAKKLEVAVDKIKTARTAAEIYSVMPLDEQLVIFESHSNTVEDAIIQDNMVECITNIIDTLSDRERLIMQLYYFEELNLKEISQTLKITQSRISQIHKSVLIKVRKSLNSEQED